MPQAAPHALLKKYVSHPPPELFWGHCSSNTIELPMHQQDQAINYIISLTNAHEKSIYCLVYIKMYEIFS